jgi:hypothetical protein
MSALSQKQTFAAQNGMSALTPIADMCSARADVCFGPEADIAPTFFTGAERSRLKTRRRSRRG